MTITVVTAALELSYACQDSKAGKPSFNIISGLSPNNIHSRQSTESIV